jgi:hypothetical protein
MTDNECRERLVAIIKAWESLPGGQNYRPHAVAEWLSKEMSPEINKARTFLGMSNKGNNFRERSDDCT